MNYKCKSPILFLVFSRLSSTKLVFSSIKNARPKKLYIAADGPRKDKIGESKKVADVRDYILSSIDWECSTKTLFREKNLGCKNAISCAIEWFFDNEEEGIILEDDVVPSNTFFYFCDQNLNYHRKIYIFKFNTSYNCFNDNICSIFWTWNSWYLCYQSFW